MNLRTAAGGRSNEVIVFDLQRGRDVHRGPCGLSSVTRRAAGRLVEVVEELGAGIARQITGRG